MALALEASGVDPNRLPSVLKSAHVWRERLASRSETGSALGELVDQAQLSRESLHLSLKLPLALSEPSEIASAVSLSLSRLVPMHKKRRGVEMRIVLEGDANLNRVDPPLLKAVARARRWIGELVSGRVRSVNGLARREGIDCRSVRRLIRLGFLSPRIIEAIVEGRQPVELSVEALTRRIELPLLWNA
jgi:site-specific DNA recombinase